MFYTCDFCSRVSVCVSRCFNVGFCVYLTLCYVYLCCLFGEINKQASLRARMIMQVTASDYGRELTMDDNSTADQVPPALSNGTVATAPAARYRIEHQLLLYGLPVVLVAGTLGKLRTHAVPKRRSTIFTGCAVAPALC